MTRTLMWGGATASSQYEGAATAGGKGLDTQDVRPWKPRTSNATCETRLLTASAVAKAKADLAVGEGNYPFTRGTQGHDHLEEDIALLQELGIDLYRFTLSWPRLFPQGDEAEPSPAGGVHVPAVLGDFEDNVSSCKSHRIKYTISV